MTSLRLNGIVYGLFAVPSQEMTYLRWLREADTEPVGLHNEHLDLRNSGHRAPFPLLFIREDARECALDDEARESAGTLQLWAAATGKYKF